MGKKRIMFYGDSNTYGFDGADYIEGRYPASVRWVDVVAKNYLPDWEVLSDGLNGRRIPPKNHLEPWAAEPLRLLGKEGYFSFMLGTNDVASGYSPKPEVAMRAMEIYLAYLTSHHDPEKILLVAPVYIEEPEFLEACQLMNGHFHYLSRRYGVHFCDAAEWGIELSPDAVHFSREGHATFAREISRQVKELWGGDEV